MKKIFTICYAIILICFFTILNTSCSNDEIFYEESILGGYKVYLSLNYEKINKENIEELVIPSNFNGKDYTEIAIDGFDYLTTVKKIILEEGIISLGNVSRAKWVENNSIEEIILPNSLKYVNLGVTFNSFFTSLKKLKYNNYENGKYLGNSSNPYLALIEMPKNFLEPEIKINENTKIVVSIENAINLVKLIVPKNVTQISLRDNLKLGEIYNLSNLNLEAGQHDRNSYIVHKSLDEESTLTIRDDFVYQKDYIIAYIGKDKDIIMPDCDSLDRYTFAYNKLNSVTLPSSIQIIGGYVFTYSEINIVNIPSNIEEIYAYAFYCAYELKQINIPNNVKKIGRGAFLGCEKLETVYIPESIDYIGIEWFSGCTNLKNVVVHEDIESIGNFAFSRCSNLESFTISKNVKVIAEGAFSECTNLKDLSYTGTISDWNQITKNENWNNQVPATVVHCTDGDVKI